MLSQTVMEVELTVVEFTYWQLVTQEELDLWMKFGEEQAEQMKVAGEPMDVVWIPNGRAQVALHWLMVPFRI